MMSVMNMMSRNKREGGLTARITVGILVTQCLLLPRDLSAQELKNTVNPASSEQERLFQRLEELERANTAQQDLIRSFAQEQERLKQRVKELETVKTVQKDATQEAATRSSAKEQERLPQRAEEMETAKTAQEVSIREDAIRSFTKEQERLKQRVEELEITKTAQEDATRSIIGSSLSKLGSNINQNVALGGTLEALTGRTKDFSGQSSDLLELTTAQLDFEIKVNDWTNGVFTIEWLNDTGTLFPTNRNFATQGQGERLNIETAQITVGDPQKFPPFLTVGRMTLPFGISTGNPVADVLTIEDPLTLEVFEMRNTAIGFGLGFPTPALKPATPPVATPQVKPQVINPFISSLSSHLGYNPPPVRPPAPTLFTPAPEPPLFNAGIYSYASNNANASGWNPSNHINATAGFRTKGNCGRPYDQLSESILCPWAIDVDVDYNSSVFDSRFLGFQYQNFLDQIGLVPGMAVSAKATLGRVSLVTEWNGAINQATFGYNSVDANDDPVRLVKKISPSAWQVSLGYQFDWNPWVEVIGEKGTYLAVGYSESQDLAGVTETLIDPITGELVVQDRVGFVPRRRFLVNVSEWVLDGVRLSVEYSHIMDYSVSQGGTGNSANGVFTGLTYAW
ncbi:MAG: hypothetical protein ACXW1Z_12150 [Methylobacter sp.]